MKRVLLIVAIALGMGVAPDSHAAILIKKNTAAVTAQANTSNEEAVANATTTPAATTTAHATETKKHSLLYKVFHKAENRGSDTIPLALYIIMAILPLGWLAMGINDNFSGWAWIVSLLLYFVFYLPGVIFTLVWIPNYY